MSALGYLLVALAGGVGAVLRFLVGGLVSRRVRAFPLGTLVVNGSGCLAMGLVSALSAHGAALEPLTLSCLTAGLLGGYTTYSSFNEETLRLWEAGARGRALGYVAATLGLCAGAALAGLSLGARLAR